MKILLLCSLMSGSPSPQEGMVVVLAETIHTGAGPVIRNGALVIQGGKIRSIGNGENLPEGAKILRFGKRVVIPGLVDAGSGIGVGGRANEDASEITPDIRILDGVEPDAVDLRRARRSGVTTLYVGPGNRNVIGGLGSVVKTVGATRREMILKEESALKAALGASPSSNNFPPRGSPATFYSRRPTTRMGVVWEFRKAFHDAESGTLKRALRRELPLRISASRTTDIESAVALADEFGLSVIIEEGQEACRMAELLAKKKIPVLLRPALTIRGTTGRDGSRSNLNAFAILRKAGVDVALLPAGSDSGTLLAGAAFAVRHGADRSDALRAVTATPARLLGVDGRVGTLEPGKDADFVVLSGDPLDLRSRVERVFVGGRHVAEDSEAK